MERRRDLRFEIRLQCRVQPIGSQQVIDCMTINLSRSGALIRLKPAGYSAKLPQPGDILWAEVPLPAHRQFKQRCLAVKATAVRIREENGGWLVALRFERIQFANAKPVPAPRASVAVM